VPPHPRRYFDGIAQHMAPAGFAELWVGVSPEGKPVAFHNDTRFNAASVYHTGCSETAHLDSGVNYLLFWAAMRGAREAGCAWYEIGEIFPAARDGKSRGLTVFKSKFGGELHRYFRGRLAIEQPVTAVEVSAPAQAAPDAPVGTAQPPAAAPIPPPSPWRQWYQASRALARHVIGPRS
jgi:GNAT acetyltransferase-like protein